MSFFMQYINEINSKQNEFSGFGHKAYFQTFILS